MKKWKIILVLLALMLLMSACGTGVPENEEEMQVYADCSKELGAIVQKDSFGEYTYEDIRFLLNSTMLEIGHAWDIPMDKEYYEGYLLPGRTLATPGIFLDKHIFIGGSYNHENGWVVLPFVLTLFGAHGEKTPFEGFTFQMDIDEVNDEVYDIEDDFFKRFEALGKEPAKCIRLKEEGLEAELYFYDVGDGRTVLHDVLISLEKIDRSSQTRELNPYTDYPVELDVIMQKDSLGEYTHEDLHYLLNSSIRELGHASGESMDKEVYQSYLLPGHTMSSPGIFLNHHLFAGGSYDSEYGWEILPLGLYLFGRYGEKTPFEGFVFEMDISEVDTDVYCIEHSFFKEFEALGEEAAKCIRLEEDGLEVELYFLNYGYKDESYILCDIIVKLKGNTWE